MHSILTNTRRPDVTFYPDGRIDITARVAKILDLHQGDVIDIAVNGGLEYLLYIRYRGETLVGKHEAVCRQSKRRSRNFRAYSKRICSFIFRFTDMKNQPLRVPAGEVLTYKDYGKMVPLITRMNITYNTEPHD